MFLGECRCDGGMKAAEFFEAEDLEGWLFTDCMYTGPTSSLFLNPFGEIKFGYELVWL